MSAHGDLESGTVAVDGARVHFWKAGSGPALVLLHGLVATGLSWEPNLAALASVRTVYALDMPNMGLTERVPGAKACLAATAAWVRAFLDAIEVEQADLVGSSHGGAVALRLAADEPGRVRSLVLFAPANPYCLRARPLIWFYTSWLGRGFARTIPWMPRFAHVIAHRRVYGDPAKVTQGALKGYLGGLNQESITHSLAIVKTWWDDMAELERDLPLKTPALLVWGDRDDVVGLDSGVKLNKALNARLAVVRGAGHLPFAEEPEETNRLMLDWLTTAVDAAERARQ